MQMFLQPSRYASHEHIFNWRMAGGGGLWRREIYTHFVWNANCLTITDAEKAFDVEKEFLAIFGCSAAQKTVFRRKIEINVYVVAFYLFRPRPIAMRHFFPFGNKFRHVFVHAWWNFCAKPSLLEALLWATVAGEHERARVNRQKLHNHLLPCILPMR